MRIQYKLFFILILFSAVLVSTIASLVQWSIGNGMIEYVNTQDVSKLEPLIADLSVIYQKNKSWDSLTENPRLFHEKIKNTLLEGDPNVSKRIKNLRRPPPPNRGGPPPHFEPASRSPESLNDMPPHERFPPDIGDSKMSYALLDIDKSFVVGKYPPHIDYSYTPIEVKNSVIGYLAVSKRTELAGGYELDFIESQREFLWLIVLGLMLLVVIVTLPLARHLVTPLRNLTAGVHQLTQGNYKQKMQLTRKDELGDLSRDFTELASTLDKNDSARKRWLANISHELRTPVAILKGELEAMIDGVRVLSLTNITSAHQEVQHLERLIADLQVLTSTDIGGMKYRKENIELVEFIERESPKYRDYLKESTLTLNVVFNVTKVCVYADETRLCQLMDNLINNCSKYAFSGSQVKISLSLVEPLLPDERQQVSIVIEDDGVGVPTEHLPHLFEHLYRVEDSRNRKTGGTGLGLSICAYIVEAHQGTIESRVSSLGGLAVEIRLPPIE